MNALIKFPKFSKNLPAVPKAAGVQAVPLDHLEFLPANLEIIETPPSPKASWLLWCLCGLLAVAIGWSWFASLDIYAIARGRVQPSGRSKVVQPLESGKVLQIAVANGARVKAGDLLIELDPTDSRADRNTYLSQREWLDAEIVRRSAAVKAVQDDVAKPDLVFPTTVSELIQTRERAALYADLAQFRSARDSLSAQSEVIRATKKRLEGSIAARQKLIASLRERLKMKEDLVARDSGTRASVLEALQVVQNEETNLAYDQGQLLEAGAQLEANDKKIAQLSEEFVAKQTQEYLDSQRKRSDVQETLIKAEAKEGRTRLTAPIDGTVQQLAVTTVGQVVTTGQPLMVIVPASDKLEVEALVENSDIAFVRPGQEATIKVDSFPFTRYGILHGTVTRVSADAVDQREAGMTGAAVASSRGANASSVSSVPQMQGLVYPVVIELSKLSIQADGKDVPLTPGMTVTAEVRTGSRRVIQYLLAPLWETTSQAGLER